MSEALKADPAGHQWLPLSDAFAWCCRCGSLARELDPGAPVFWAVGFAGLINRSGALKLQAFATRPRCRPVTDEEVAAEITRTRGLIADARDELRQTKEENATLREEVVARRSRVAAPQVYFDDVESYVDLCGVYGEEADRPDFVRETEVRFAAENGDGYSSFVIVIFERAGEFFEATSSHCSCNGHEWGFSRITAQAIAMRPLSEEWNGLSLNARLQLAALARSGLVSIPGGTP